MKKLNKKTCKECINESRYTEFGKAPFDDCDDELWKEENMVICPNTRPTNTKEIPPDWCKNY
jgi:hypothetical protein